jgi:hypothetical protein
MKFLQIIIILLTLSIQVNGQSDCKYPFEESADSLVKFVISDIHGIRTLNKINQKFYSQRYKENFYNPGSELNHDLAFQTCINDLRDKLGEELFCNNVDLYINSFSNYRGKHSISFGFTYPVLKRKEAIRLGTFISSYERINIKYEYSFNYKGEVNIVFPKNIPDCQKKSDCNIYVTREKALEILNFWGLIKENDIVNLSVNGDYWKVRLLADNINRELKINIHTGEFSNFKKGAICTSPRVVIIKE